MNSLSWALYAAEVLGRVNVLFVLVGLALGPGALIVTGIQRSDEPKATKWAWPKGLMASGCALLFLACLAPSEKTVYMIAASEVGERVAVSPEGREMLDLVRRRIRELLSDKA